MQETPSEVIGLGKGQTMCLKRKLQNSVPRNVDAGDTEGEVIKTFARLTQVRYRRHRTS